jgi:hypothetical protein
MATGLTLLGSGGILAAALYLRRHIRIRIHGRRKKKK